jgi:hypothetical protein
MHTIAIDGLHWHWCIGVESIEILHWRRVMRIWTILMPLRMVFKRFLMMMFVVHL